jgi:hypothetical protein
MEDCKSIRAHIEARSIFGYFLMLIVQAGLCIEGFLGSVGSGMVIGSLPGHSIEFD